MANQIANKRRRRRQYPTKNTTMADVTKGSQIREAGVLYDVIDENTLRNANTGDTKRVSKNREVSVVYWH